VSCGVPVDTCDFMAVSVGAVGVRHHLRAPRRPAREEYLHHLRDSNKGVLREYCTSTV
jgi:hypothetical protein